MTTAPNPRAWAVATALAAESGLRWGRWASGHPVCPECGECNPPPGFRHWMLHLKHGGGYVDIWTRDEVQSNELEDAIAHVERENAGPASTPVPAPWDADAYRADCARRGVEPGSMPSLEYDNPTGYGWCVVSWALNSGGQRMFVQMLWCGRLLCTWTPDALQFVDDGCCHREHAAVFVGWATAAKRAMGT